jgi:hypothetical protein
MCDSNFSVETQIDNLQHFETGFDRETGINHSVSKIIENVQSTSDYDHLVLLTNAIKYIRDVRGLRDLSYSALFTLHHHYAHLALSILKSFVFHDETSSIGCWKDVRNYAKFCKKHNSKISVESIFSLYNDQLKQDYELFMKHRGDDICPRMYLSFAAKYVPRESKDADAFEFLVSNWYNISRVDVTSWHRMSYRKIVSSLNRAIDTLEIRMCDWDWTNISGGKIPYVALELNRANLIGKSPHLRTFYETNDAIYDVPYYFMQNPWKIIKNVICAKDNREIIDKMNLYWQKYLENARAPQKDYIIPVLDLSPAMVVDTRHLCVAIANALTFASNSLFGNRVLTFSQKVVWVDLDKCPLNIAVERILGVTANVQGCPCCVMNVLMGAFKSANMTDDDLEKMKIIMLTKGTTFPLDPSFKGNVVLLF